MVKEKVKREFSVLTEEISPENVEVMAELIALKCTKSLIGFMGYHAEKAHKRLYKDVFCKGERGYVLSDSYDLVQSVAVFLCEHFGEHLDDYFCTTKKGKIYTIKMNCYRIIGRMLSEKYRRMKSDISYENLSQENEPRYEHEEPRNDEEGYSKVEKIIAGLELSAIHSTVLRCRMDGMSFPAIGRIIGRCSGTACDLLGTVRRKYIRLYGEI